MSKSDDRETVEKSDEMKDEGEDAPLAPDPSPARGSSSNVSSGGGSAPRMARFGEGKEGGGGRRERGVRDPRASLFGRIGQFIRDTRGEMRRVSWPGATEVKNTTIITIIAVVFFAIFFFVVDHIWTFLLTQLEHFIAWLVGG